MQGRMELYRWSTVELDRWDNLGVVNAGEVKSRATQAGSYRTRLADSSDPWSFFSVQSDGRVNFGVAVPAWWSAP
jgi:hypothetical protein